MAITDLIKNRTMKIEQKKVESTDATDGKVMLADVYRLIDLHQGATALTLMRALKVTYNTASESLQHWANKGHIAPSNKLRYHRC